MTDMFSNKQNCCQKQKEFLKNFNSSRGIFQILLCAIDNFKSFRENRIKIYYQI